MKRYNILVILFIVGQFELDGKKNSSDFGSRKKVDRSEDKIPKLD